MAGKQDLESAWVTGGAIALAGTAVLLIALLGWGRWWPGLPEVSAGPFNVLSAELRFDEGPPRALATREEVRPVVDISYVGSGEIEGVFELADAGSPGGDAGYRELRRIRRSVAPGQHVQIRGPALPTDRPGAHRVRFRLVSPPRVREVAAAEYAVEAPRPVPAAMAP